VGRTANERLTDGFATRGFPKVRASYGSVLIPLWAEDGLRMGTLAARARLSKQTITTLIRLVERDGLVARELDEYDRRATRVWLTQPGFPVIRRNGGHFVRIHRTALERWLEDFALGSNPRPLRRDDPPPRSRRRPVSQY